MNDFNLNVFGICETWLTNQTPDSFVTVPGYELVRTDTSGHTPKHGVCFYVRKCISYESVPSNCPNLHTIYLSSYNIYVVLVYRPPSNSEEDNTCLLEYLANFVVGKEVLIMGDFNLPEIKWTSPNCMFAHHSPTVQKFLDTFLTLGLTQWVHSPTFYPSTNTLDLVFTTEHDRLGTVDVLAPFPNCGHCPIIFDYFFQLDSSLAPNVNSMNKHAWFKGKFNRIEQHIHDIDWQYEFYNLTVDAMYSRFLELLSPLIDLYIPVKPIALDHHSHINPPSQLKKERARAWSTFKVVRQREGRHSPLTHVAFDYFNSCNANYRNYYINYQVTYEQKLIDKLHISPKCFHSYIRDKKKGAPAIGPLRLSDGSLCTSTVIMAEIFANEFSSVYKYHDPSTPAAHQVFNGHLNNIYLSFPDVIKSLAVLDTNTSMGPDGIHPLLLHSCPSLALPLHLIYQKSLTEGTLPTSWKHSNIIPIFKKGSRSTALNYRPISLTSVPCKILERLITQHLLNYFEVNNLFSSDQFGFRTPVCLKISTINP